ncbi:MAG: DUF6056 family protein [Eubacteriales bacterium]|nr:DUF6056 family protein [Eubacteriales bacterium]
MRKNLSLSAERRESSLLTLLSILAIVVLLCSLVPMALIARFNLPLGDDVIYGSPVASALEKDDSISTALSAAVGVVAEKYQSWQGTFSAIFLMALQPGVFGLAYYQFTPYFMLTALVVSTLLLTYTLLCSILGASKRVWLLIGSVITFFSIQLCISPREAFFWYNGAVYYTFFHSLLLVLATLVLRIIGSKSAWVRAVFAAVGVLLCGILSGGNYATAMVCFELLVCAAAYSIYRKDVRLLAAFGLMLLVFCAGMYVSVSAPGNAVRQASVIASGYTPSGPFRAVIFSLALGGAMAVGWFDLACVVIIALVALFVGPVLKKTNWSFRCPLLVVAFLFCVFASQFTPSVYAATSPGPLRLRNVAYFVYLLLIALSAAYVTGWAQRKFPRESVRLPAVMRWLVTYPVLAVLCFGALLGASLCKKDVFSTPSIVAVSELRDGTAQEYAAARTRQLTGKPQNTGDTPTRESKLLS